MAMATRFKAFPRRQVQLLDGELKRRFDVNRYYLMSLSTDGLVFNHRLEAVLADGEGRNPHGGWERCGCHLRGHFLGHWLSAASRIYAATGDEQLKAKADAIIEALAECQQRNGGEWVGPIPPKYLDLIAQKRCVWAPHYNMHKTLMGLYDMYAYAGNERALDVMIRLADWFHRWSGRFTREEMDDILDVETGGMLESWADLYAVTGDPKHRELVDRYDRRRLFDLLIRGEDVLSGGHGNTMIPEFQGAARAAEVLDDERYRTIAVTFWDAVVPSRMYATGGHTHDEVWSKPNELAGTLVAENQELCTVYNMMWLTKRLFRWTGDIKYADYYERDLVNGILAMQHAESGMFTGYLSFKTGGVKKWGTRTNDFWCCYGTGVQAAAEHPSAIYFHDDDTLVVNLFAASRVEWNSLTLTQRTAFPQDGSSTITVEGGTGANNTIAIRVPWWTAAPHGVARARGAGAPPAGENGPSIKVNGQAQKGLSPSSYCEITRAWKPGDTIDINYPMTLWACPMPDDANLIAAMYGPMVLAGLVAEDTPIKGDPADPSSWLEQTGNLTFRTKNQPTDFDLIPMWRVTNQPFGVYFHVTL